MANGRPAITDIIELLSKKWVMRIIWELRDDPLTFRELQIACGDISPTILNNRLKLLGASILVQKNTPNGYCLTGSGRDLLEVYKPLNHWAKAWQAKRATKGGQVNNGRP